MTASFSLITFGKQKQMCFKLCKSWIWNFVVRAEERQTANQKSESFWIQAKLSQAKRGSLVVGGIGILYIDRMDLFFADELKNRNGNSMWVNCSNKFLCECSNASLIQLAICIQYLIGINTEALLCVVCAVLKFNQNN